MALYGCSDLLRPVLWFDEQHNCVCEDELLGDELRQGVRVNPKKFDGQMQIFPPSKDAAERCKFLFEKAIQQRYQSTAGLSGQKYVWLKDIIHRKQQ